MQEVTLVYLNAFMIAHTKWKNVSLLGKLLAFWGDEKASWSYDSASGSCSIQTCSWLLLTGPGWSKFTSQSSITDFLQKLLFFRRMWVKQNHNFLQKPLLSQTLDGRYSYVQIPFGQKGRPHWLNVQGTFFSYRWVISFKPLTHLTQNSK